MKIVKFDSNEFDIWCSNLDGSNIRIPYFKYKIEELKTYYFLLKYLNLLHTDDFIEITTKSGEIYTYYIYVLDKKDEKNTMDIFNTTGITTDNNLNIIRGKSRLKNFYIFFDYNFVIYNDKIYVPDNKKDTIIFERIRKFKEIEKINENDKEII